ncbi:MAG: hypothetical protein PHP53_23610 [Prolixibacteraceae bacterium]|nr:hypothetical protein [Prolixibacteraceae bacterium]
MKSFITFLFFAFSLITVGQTKIEGIGKFKLKKTTTAYLDTLCKEQGFVRIPIKNYEMYLGVKNDVNKLIEFYPDTTNLRDGIMYAHHCKNVRAFLMQRITISGIEISGTFLTFYNDTLVQIRTDYNNKIVEAFTLKYGNPELSKKEREVECTLKETGVDIKLLSATYYQTWGNDNIKCSAVLGDFRDRNCEKKNISFIKINIDEYLDKIMKCDDQEKERIRTLQEIEKKKKLDDF